jgi:hypothetical protein
MNNIALYNFVPNYCPHCGAPTHLNDLLTPDELAWKMLPRATDLNCGASHTCKCGVSYQKIETPTALEAARKHGDLADYVTE